VVCQWGLGSAPHQERMKATFMTLVDYRDRASVLIWLVLMGLAAQRLLILPVQTFSQTVLGSPITITLSGTTVFGLLLTGMAASGTEAVVRAHPRAQSRALGHLWVFWGLPMALVVVALLLLPLSPSPLYWFAALVLTGIVLGLSLAGIYYTVDPFATGYRRARLGLNALTYGVALILFLVVYRTRVRSILSATEVMILSSLLALELLRGSERPLGQVTLYAAITGLVLGEVTWALNYWRLASLTGGLLLLLMFYDVVGLAQHALQGRVTRRVLIEFALISVATLALIWEYAP
jgi:hypothetical protein